MARNGKPKKDQLRVRRVVDVPLREVSGICSRRSANGRMSLIAVGDAEAEIAWSSLSRDDGSEFNWHKKSIAKLAGSELPKHDPQIEAICADGIGRILLLQEDPQRAELVDLKSLETVALIDLVVEGRDRIARAWRDPDGSRGEGAVFLAGGHLLIAKEKKPPVLIEFGPPHSPSRGLVRGGALGDGKPWPIGKGRHRFVALATWLPDKTLTNTCADFSDLAIGPDGWLYLLSDQSATLARLDDLPAGGGIARLRNAWLLGDLDGKPEGLAFTAEGHAIVGLDTRKARRNLVLLEPAVANSQDATEVRARYETWPVRGILRGKDGKKSKDVSGIDCTTTEGFPRAGLVIDDNMQEAQFVTVSEGEIVAGDMIPLIDNTFDGKRLELDGEGVAYADGYFYVIGSHGHPRDTKSRLDPDQDAARIAAHIVASSQIVRFRSDGARATGPIERTAKLRALIAQQPDLRKYQDQRLEKNGLTIEGIAVRRGCILVGFRGPPLKGGRAAVLSVAVEGVFGKAPPNARLYRLPLGRGTSVRDLAACGDGVLVLAGPIASGPGPYGIYWWDGKSDDAVLLKDLADVVGKNGKRKPEALLPLDEDASSLRVLVLFDGEKEAAPVAVTVARPRTQRSKRPAP